MKLYNSLSKTKQEFSTLEEQIVKMYVCGITPYDTTHLGHAFVYVFFDTLKRYFEFHKYSVEYTQNVTDIDDDILKRAIKMNQDWQELGNFWTNKFIEDTKNLNIVPPTHYVKATHSIKQIISIVTTLIKKKTAYEKNGNVYFSVEQYKEYGQLSDYPVEQMIQLSKERGADPNDKNKKNPLDFILWQKSLKNEPSWQSPWGKGRPGWHIECSAMIQETLGEQIDIHGGGFDLIYPHHESEIAQSESATGKRPFVQFWMHVAMLSYQGEKMSKSLGNLVLISDLLKKYSANQIRFLLLSHHYRVPWEFTYEEFEQKNTELAIIEKALNLSVHSKYTSGEIKHNPLENEFFDTLNDDMNTPKALSVLSKFAEMILRHNFTQNISSEQLVLKKLTGMIGLTR